MLDAVLEESHRSPGPWVIVLKVEESMPKVKPPLDCVFIKQRFMAALGCEEDAAPGGPA